MRCGPFFKAWSLFDVQVDEPSERSEFRVQILRSDNSIDEGLWLAKCQYIQLKNHSHISRALACPLPASLLGKIIPDESLTRKIPQWLGLC